MELVQAIYGTKNGQQYFPTETEMDKGFHR